MEQETARLECEERTKKEDYECDWRMRKKAKAEDGTRLEKERI